MSTSIPLDQAEQKFRELVEHLSKGDEVTVTDNDEIVARIIGERTNPKSRPGPGLCQGMIEIVADDDEHLKDFAEYMP
jgi:antitoxin (DNA-binding transcriptional repressor) of toxin-antitoxin stability system